MDVVYVMSASKRILGTTRKDVINGNNLRYEDCIKIGHTRDLKGRLIAYRTSIPGFILLYAIKNGTEEDEKKLHIYFNKFRRKDLNGKEWFIWNKEIINFFETHRKIDSIREVLEKENIVIYSGKIGEKMRALEINKERRGAKQAQHKAVNKITSIISDVVYSGITIENLEKINDIYTNLLKLNTDNLSILLNYLKEKYEYNQDQLSLIEKRFNQKLSDELSNYLIKFNKFTNFIDKMRYLCEEVTVNLKEEELNRFLECIPLAYKNAYLILGPTRLKSLAYRKYRIEEEYKTIMNNQASDNILDKKIFENFTIGNKYTKEFLKSKLSEIYKEVGYQKTAKANDIEKWFEVKTLKVTNKETGKRDSCFYLMKIK